MTERIAGFRLVACCVLIAGLAFVQEPGFLAADTKFDLSQDPLGFLQRALHLWDGSGAFGQLQNQAYGYLWPMGPVFAAGSTFLPGWAVQRLWLALVMCVAFVGAAKVTRALGVRSEFACLVAGFAYALSPRMLSTLGQISIEAWPSALAPFVLLPLITGARSGSPRRAAALSALAVAMVGGVNAAATFAVLPLGVVWLLTRTPGPRRRSMMLWWPVFTLIGTLWWLVPLFLMGAYSPPFLNYIESSSVTTIPTTLFDTLRGTSHWVPYIDGQVRAGRELLESPVAIINSGVVLFLGILGLFAARTQHRRFLSLSVVLGLVMVTAGHQGDVQGWFAAAQAQALDGSLAPLRNVHKFDPILRLPLVVGLAWALQHAFDRAPETAPGGDRMGLWNRRLFAVLAAAAVLGASLPGLSGRIVPEGALLAVPEYWQDASTWLDQEYENDGATALLVPGSAFATYSWGEPRDEPLQWLAASPWAVRNVIPLAPPGNIRMLDEIERRINQGVGSPGLVAGLQRAGVRYLVVRNDLTRGSDVPDPVVVHEAIAESPGLSVAAIFGPSVGGDGHFEGDDGRILVGGGWQSSYPAIEVFSVPRPPASRAGVTVAEAPVVAGGPEDLIDLVDAGVLGPDEPTVLAADRDRGEEGPPGDLILTDGLQERERFFGRVHDGYSSMLTKGDEPQTGNPTSDYLAPGWEDWRTGTRLTGIRAVSASSSGSDSTTFGGARQGEAPYAAVDGLGQTSWNSSSFGDEGRAWWQVDLDTEIAPRSVVVEGGQRAVTNQEVRVRTDSGLSDGVVVGPGERKLVLLDGESTEVIRVEEAGPVSGQLSLADVSIPGVSVARSLTLPQTPDDWGVPSAIVLRALTDGRSGCVSIELDVRCVAGRDRVAEETQGFDRIVPLSDDAQFAAELTVRPRGGAALDDLVLDGQALDIETSSMAVRDPRSGPVSAIDGDDTTTWIADPTDPSPTLNLSWLGVKSVRGISIDLDDDAAARRPTRLLLTWPDGEREVRVGKLGVARFPVIRTGQIKIEIVDTAEDRSLEFDGTSSDLGVGITELSVRRVPYLPLRLSLDRRDLGCGSGPTVEINGSAHESAVSASPLELARGVVVPARLCDVEGAETDAEVDLVAGENRIVVTGNDAFAGDRLVLAEDGRESTSQVGSTSMTKRGPVTRTLEVEDPGGLLAMRENVNPGWSASAGGRPLESVVVDGWRQGWRLPPDVDTVSVRFAPDRFYRVALAGGLALLVALMVGCVWPRRSYRRRMVASGERPMGLIALSALGVVAGGVLAGWPGVLIALLTGGAMVAARWAHDLTGTIVAGLMLAAALFYVIAPWGNSSGWAGRDVIPQYLALIAVIAVLVRPSPGASPGDEAPG
ncbi:alpha-(1-_3)-arabinofuranosyltransferase [Nocardioides salsibiostraticola]